MIAMIWWVNQRTKSAQPLQADV